MSTLAVVRLPGVLRTLGLAAIARLPMSVIGVLVLLQTRQLGLSYAVGGAAMGAFTLGMAAGAPIIGRLVDRRGQPRVLLVTGLSAGLATICIAHVPASVPGVLIVLSALIGVAQPPIAACARVILTRLLTGRERDAMFAVDVSVAEIAYSVGPLALLSLAAAAGPPVALEATGLVLVVGTCGFALGTEARVMRGATEPSVRIGLGAIAKPGVLTIVGLTATLGVSWGAVEVGVIAAAERHHGLPLPVLFGGWALGSILGGLLAARHANGTDRTRKGRVLLLALAAATFLLAIPMPAWWLVASLALSGIVTAPLLALLYAMISEIAPAGALTEAYAWQTTGITGGLALGVAAAGVITTWLGVGAVFLAATAAVLASSVVWAHRSTTVNRQPQPST